MLINHHSATMSLSHPLVGLILLALICAVAISEELATLVDGPSGQIGSGVSEVELRQRTVRIYNDRPQWECEVCHIDGKTGRKIFDDHGSCYSLQRDGIIELPLPSTAASATNSAEIWQFVCGEHHLTHVHHFHRDPHSRQHTGVLTLHPGTTQFRRRVSEIATDSRVSFDGEGETISLQVDFETGEEKDFEHFPSPEEQLAMLHQRKSHKLEFNANSAATDKVTEQRGE